MLPVDFVVSDKFGEDGEMKTVDLETDGGVPDGFRGLDSGPLSRRCCEDHHLERSFECFRNETFATGRKKMMNKIVIVTEAGTITIASIGRDSTYLVNSTIA